MNNSTNYPQHLDPRTAEIDTETWEKLSCDASIVLSYLRGLIHSETETETGLYNQKRRYILNYGYYYWYV